MYIHIYVCVWPYHISKRAWVTNMKDFILTAGVLSVVDLLGDRYVHADIRIASM